MTRQHPSEIVPAPRDRRCQPRAETLFRVESDHGPMFAQDVALGGMLVTSRLPCWPGQLVRVRFVLPGQDRAIRLTCRVHALEHAPQGAALVLRFLRLSSEAALALHSYIDSRPIVSKDVSMAARVRGWMERIDEDCRQLLALVRA